MTVYSGAEIENPELRTERILLGSQAGAPTTAHLHTLQEVDLHKQ